MKGYTRIVAEKFATMSAQLVSLADVYDALISERCYKAVYSKGSIPYEKGSSFYVKDEPFLIQSSIFQFKKQEM